MEEPEEEEDEEEQAGKKKGRNVFFCICCCVLVIVVVIIIVAAGGACEPTIMVGLNKQPGQISKNLKRVVIEPRSNYMQEVEALGLTYHDEPSLEFSSCEEQAYYSESAAIEMTDEAEREIMEATQNVYYMCLEVVDIVIKDPNLLRLFRVPSDLWPGMRESWGLVHESTSSRAYYDDDPALQK